MTPYPQLESGRSLRVILLRARRKIRRVLGLKKTYRDIVLTYREYSQLQKQHYCSYEAEVPRWEEGQRRFIDRNFDAIPTTSRILDIACGDGVGLRCFQSKGYMNVVGVEFNEPKAARAKKSVSYPVFTFDIHDLSAFPDNSFDVVYSSHTVEHAYRPRTAVDELTRVLRRGGTMIIVLPYPDVSESNDPAHGAKYELGTNRLDDGQTVCAFFERSGLILMKKQYDDFRQPEIWLHLQKK